MALTSDITSVYNSILNQIDTIVDSNNNKIFQVRNVWNSQVKRMLDAKGLSWNLPGVWVEILPGKTENLTLTFNGIDLNIIFHIVMQQLDAGYGSGNFDQNLSIFSYRNNIHRTFQDYMPTQCGNMLYMKEKQQYNHTNLYEYQIEYVCYYVDPTAYISPLTMSATYSWQINEELNPDPNEFSGVGWFRITNPIYPPILGDFIIS